MSTNFKHICVVGLGYIGLPTAATFASHGVRVTGVDVNQHAVDTINQGKVHIVEPDLDMLVKTVVENGMLCARTSPVEADAYIVAVPTPFQDDHQPEARPGHLEVVVRCATTAASGNSRSAGRARRGNSQKRQAHRRRSHTG